MNKYIKDGKVINATEKAYEVIYKAKGYTPVEEKKEEVKDISKMKKDELLLVASEKGIEIPEDATKEVLISLIKEVEEKKEDRCHINTIPKRLNSLIQEFLIEQYKLNEDGILECKKQISSVSDNRQTVQFENIGGLTYVSKSADEFLDKNMTTLVKYRRMRWRNEDTK